MEAHARRRHFEGGGDPARGHPRRPFPHEQPEGAQPVGMRERVEGADSRVEIDIHETLTTTLAESKQGGSRRTGRVKASKRQRDDVPMRELAVDAIGSASSAVKAARLRSAPTHDAPAPTRSIDATAAACRAGAASSPRRHPKPRESNSTSGSVPRAMIRTPPPLCAARLRGVQPACRAPGAPSHPPATRGPSSGRTGSGGAAAARPILEQAAATCAVPTSAAAAPAEVGLGPSGRRPAHAAGEARDQRDARDGTVGLTPRTPASAAKANLQRLNTTLAPMSTHPAKKRRVPGPLPGRRVPPPGRGWSDPALGEWRRSGRHALHCGG